MMTRPHGGFTYERLGRLGISRPWMPPLAILAAAFGSLLLFCVGLTAATIISPIVGVPVNDDAESGTILTPYADNIVLLVIIGLLVPVVLLVVRFVQRRPAGTLHSVESRIRWRWLAVCTVLSSITTGLLLCCLILVYDDFHIDLKIDWWNFAVVAAILVVLVPLQAAGEEYASRGFLLQTLGTYGRWIGVIASSVGFAALHGWGTWSGFTGLFLGACVWAMLVIRTGGLEVAIAAHATTNLMGFLVLAAAGDLNVADTTTAAHADQTMASLLLGTDIVYSIAVLAVLRLLARYRPTALPRNRMEAISQGGLSTCTADGREIARS